MSSKTASRVGLYIQAETRDRLNALKERMGARQISHVSQDDALNYLLDLAEENGWVGPYIQSDTRARLNTFKDRLSSKRVSQVSQDDVLNYLLDLVDRNRGDTVHRGAAVPVGNRVQDETVGQRIRRLRERAGWTQDELVARLAEVGVEMTQSNLSYVETADYAPRGDVVIGLARVFGVSADYLLGLTDEPRPLGEK